MATDIEILTKLRDGARRREWGAARFATETALARLPVPKILQIAQQEVQRRLPLLERHNPHIHWPRAWISAIAARSAGTLNFMSPELSEDVPGPGGSRFTGAVMELAMAATANDSEECITHAIGAIGTSIWAEKEEIGGTEHPKLWDFYHRDPLGLTSRAPGLHGYVSRLLLSGPKVAAVELAAWNRVADELAAALGVAG